MCCGISEIVLNMKQQMSASSHVEYTFSVFIHYTDGLFFILSGVVVF